MILIIIIRSIGTESLTKDMRKARKGSEIESF